MAELKLGILVPQGWRMDLADVSDPVEEFETMSRCALEAEKAGFDAIWVYYHFHTVPTPQLEATFECWTSMAALARDTSTIRLGQMVTCNSYRPPSLLAKMASCVDVMSHGRLILGIGAGWYQHEYEAYGYEYPETPNGCACCERLCRWVKRCGRKSKQLSTAATTTCGAQSMSRSRCRSRIRPSGSAAPARKSP